MTLRMTVEVVPYGVEEDKYVIATLDIANITTDSDGITHYNVNYSEDSGFTWEPKERIKHYRRDGFLSLLYRTLYTILSSTSEGRRGGTRIL
jgi:hypothetical protein